MHATGYLDSTSVSGGKLCVTFRLEGGQDTVDGLKDTRLVIDAHPEREKRSLKANAYCWHLIGEIARMFSQKKWTMYLHFIRDYGVFEDFEIKREALPTLKRYFRLVEEFDDGYGANNSVSGHVKIRCYFGSSKYNTKEMSDFLNGIVAEAKDCGIETLTRDELAELVAAWKAEQ